MQSSNKDIFDSLEQGVKDVFNSERYLNYLTFLSKFHNYSWRNTILIFMQNPEATLVAGFNDWKNKHKRYVKKGEKAIRIIAPYYKKIQMEVDILDNNGNAVIVNGKHLTEQKEFEKLLFRAVSVFDVSQTDGEPIPQLTNELQDTVKNYQELFTAISSFSDYPIEFEDISGSTKGYCDFIKHRIAINNGMSESQTIKTAIHELTHSRLHNPMDSDKKQDKISRDSAEVQAESVAFVVANHFGIDTSDYSFDYIASWSNGKELEELHQSLEIIQKEANIIIQGMEEQYQQLLKDRNIEINNTEKGVDRDMDGIDDSRDSSYTAKIPVPDLLSKNWSTTSPKNFKKQKYSKEENARIIADIKQSIPIHEYAQQIGFTVQRVGNYYTLKEHDSVRINPNKNVFTQNSTGVKGSIIDFVMHFENIDKAAAIDKLAKYIGADTKYSLTPIQNFAQQFTDKEKIPLVLPEKAKTMKNIFAYLINTRKIDSQIVNHWVRNGNLYQDTHNNCVFVTVDKYGKANFASQKGTNTSKPFQADVKGSDYNCCHFINNNAKSLIVCEAVIDLMSVQTILKANGRNLNNYNYLSLNGTAKTHAILNALQRSNTETVILATDNDKAGEKARTELRALASKFDENIKFVDFIPNEKDWNAELIANVQSEPAEHINSEKGSLAEKIAACQNKANNLNKNFEAQKSQSISQKRNVFDIS